MMKVKYSDIKVASTPSSMLSSLIKGVLFTVLAFLILSELINFIFLKGFEHAIAFCLFKLIIYSFGLLLLKNSDSTMMAVIAQLYEINEKIAHQLEEVMKLIRKERPIIVNAAPADDDDSNK
jgi:hypothetical protein